MCRLQAMSIIISLMKKTDPRSTHPKPASVKRSVKKCTICSRPVYSDHSIYCYRCYKFSRCMNQRGIHAVAVKNIWEHVRRHGYVCYYTGTPLNMTDPKSPWYFVFDHMIPGDDPSVVLTFALYNEMKSDLAIEEFRYYTRQLVKNEETGARIIKKKLIYWDRLFRQTVSNSSARAIKCSRRGLSKS